MLHNAWLLPRLQVYVTKNFVDYKIYQRFSNKILSCLVCSYRYFFKGQFELAFWAVVKDETMVKISEWASATTFASSKLFLANPYIRITMLFVYKKDQREI